jgi:quercetin dioxygenase-like cupin family protein
MKERLIFAGVVIGIVGVLAATALGTPGAGTSGSPAPAFRASMDDSIQINTERIKFQTKDAADVLTQTVTYAPGAYSGWHLHPGIVIVSVKEGSVTRQFADCSYERHPAGTAFIENGEDPAMEVRNLSATESAVLYVTWVVPDGGATRVDEGVDNPQCPLPPVG